MKLDRRRFLGSAAGVAATAGVAAEWLWPKHSVSYNKPRSFVAILNAAEYSEKIEALLMHGLRLFHLKVLGKTVLLKPNLVEDLPGPVNTNSVLIGAAARCFLRLGAARVTIGEGPGHQRDTELVVQAAGLEPHLKERQIEFVDLNRDELRRVKLRANYSGLQELWLPRAALESDFVVSMPKVKTHHWAGVTLSLKNMFGIVPGMKYGWPKNVLHWTGIHESILDICATVPIHFVIADGITAMEGNGPLQGNARELGKIVLADDPVSADATCARLMGFDPLQIRHLSEGSKFLGNLQEDRVTMLGEGVTAPMHPFSVLPEFRYLLARRSSKRFLEHSLEAKGLGKNGSGSKTYIEPRRRLCALLGTEGTEEKWVPWEIAVSQEESLFPSTLKRRDWGKMGPIESFAISPGRFSPTGSKRRDWGKVGPPMK